MAQQLSQNQTERIIELITPFMRDVKERRFYIDPWCANFPTLYRQIEWEGSPGPFTTDVIYIFKRYDLATSDKTALEYLLESVHADMGVRDQKEIDTILREIKESTARPPSHLPSTELSHNQRSSRLKFIFAPIVLGIIIAIVIHINRADVVNPSDFRDDKQINIQSNLKYPEVIKHFLRAKVIEFDISRDEWALLPQFATAHGLDDLEQESTKLKKDGWVTIHVNYEIENEEYHFEYKYGLVHTREQFHLEDDQSDHMSKCYKNTYILQEISGIWKIKDVDTTIIPCDH